MSSPRAKGAASGLAAALLFGFSTPVAKLLLPGSGPFMLAGLLYLGSGLGLLVFRRFQPRGDEAPLQRADAIPLLGVVFTGGMIAPVLLMYGLGRLPGSSASLLLNLEAPFTMALAVIAFGESLQRSEVVGAAAVVLGAAALTARGQLGDVHVLGALGVAGACLGWAVDNNLSQRLSLRDPVAVTQLKCLVAGVANVALALAMGERIPGGQALAGALATGLLGYGVSIVLHLRAMRRLGAARQAALFATAPFAGALASVPLLGERLSPRDILAAIAMGLGVALIVRAHHSHRHEHEPMEHEHAHEHDEHHQHPHDGEARGPHSHVHEHAALVHDHPHLPDAHHRHRHG
jgi:drug/metabolite transporter (DMT)-like permease